MTRGDELYRTISSLPPSELSAFLAVAEHGGFRAAARASGLSPSAISHAVAGLESRLKIQLFLRTTRSVTLTETGERFAEAVRPAVAQLAEALQGIGSTQEEPAGTLRINASRTAAAQILEPLLLGFLRYYPRMRIDVSTDEALIDLAEGGFDCGLRLRELVPQDMVAVPVGSDLRHVVVAAPSYLAKAPLLTSPSDLANHECIQLRLAGAASYRWEFSRHGEALQVSTKGRLVLGSADLVLAAVRAGFGIGYVFLPSVAKDLDDGRLVSLLDDWTPAYPGLAVYYSRHRHMRPGMRAFVSYLRNNS